MEAKKPEEVKEARTVGSTFLVEPLYELHPIGNCLMHNACWLTL